VIVNRSRAVWFAAGLLCVGHAQAFEGVGTDVTGAPLYQPQSFVPFSLEVHQNNGGLAFDLGGSDVRKIRLQLATPLELEATAGSNWTSGQGASVLAGAGLNFELDRNLSLSAGARTGTLSYGSFRPVGSIHCENGVLDAVSYHASNCYFVDDHSSMVNTGVLSLGTRFQLSDRMSTRLNLFQSESSIQSSPLARSYVTSAVRPDPMGLGVVPSNPLGLEDALQSGVGSFDSSVTGVDLEFEVGVSTDRAGDLVLGLQLTRVFDANYQGSWLSGPGLYNWTIAEPFDSARLSFDWQKGSFSGGVDTYFREPVSFLNRAPLDRLSTFDVHFTWRAPWNASVSVGASNVLNAGVDDNAAHDSKLSDPFESVYGRIPYVRYKQDL